MTFMITGEQQHAPGQVLLPGPGSPLQQPEPHPEAGRRSTLHCAVVRGFL